MEHPILVADSEYRQNLLEECNGDLQGNMYGLIVQYDEPSGKHIPITCMHGGSMWLCPACAIGILMDANDSGWISVEERMPTEDALYLIHAPSLDPDKPFIKTAWFDPNIVLGWQFIPKVWSDAVTHWMPLPKPPSEIKGEKMIMDTYSLKKLYETRFTEIKDICLALGIDGDSFDACFFDWYKSSPLSGSMALEICKIRLLAGLPMPWEKEETTTDGWVSVDDVLPFRYGRYLVYAPGIDPDYPLIYISLFFPSKDPGWENQTWAWSHWMPLPEPPIRES